MYACMHVCIHTYIYTHRTVPIAGPFPHCIVYTSTVVFHRTCPDGGDLEVHVQGLVGFGTYVVPEACRYPTLRSLKTKTLQKKSRTLPKP